MQPGTVEQSAAATWPSDSALINVTEVQDNIGENASGYWKNKHLVFKWVYFFVRNPSAKLGNE